MKAVVSWLEGGGWGGIRVQGYHFFGYTRQCGFHPVLYHGRFGQLVGEVNKSDSQPAFLFCQDTQQPVLIHTVSFTYPALYTITLYRMLETALRNADEDRGVRLQLLYGQIHHAQRKDRKRARTARKHLFYYLFLIQPFGFMQRICHEWIICLRIRDCELKWCVIKNELQGLRHINTTTRSSYFHCYDYKPQARGLTTYNS